MKEFLVSSGESGQRFDKYLKKRLPNAGSSFLYKMLRKKNITLNGGKADGTEMLSSEDRVNIYFSDETYAKFAANPEDLAEEMEKLALLPLKGLEILYEDADILAMNKPYNMLSQKASANDISANERMLGYLIRKGDLTEEQMASFRPSVCNRLDRNTTGVLLAGKSLHGLQELSDMLRTRKAKKYYYALVAGRVEQPAHLRGYMKKDEASNQVTLLRQPEEGAHPIETIYQPLEVQDAHSLVELQLITGRSHQLRVHLASIGHPVIGDLKYGNPRVNEEYRTKYGITHQLLHAQRVELPGYETIEAPLPQGFTIKVQESKPSGAG